MAWLLKKYAVKYKFSQGGNASGDDIMLINTNCRVEDKLTDFVMEKIMDKHPCSAITIESIREVRNAAN